jgi:hypothetical protein
MKKECKVSKFDKEIIKFLYENKEGLRARTIGKLINLKTRNLYKRLNILRKKGLIENVFPIWKINQGQVDFCSKLLNNDNIFELHNISYVVKLLKTPDWWKNRKNYLIRLKEYDFKNIQWGNNPYQQLMNESFIIQCYPESLIIISRKRYHSNNPYELCKNAISDILDLLNWFCERFNFNFFLNGIPHIEIRNNDYLRIKDILANKIKEQGASFLVELDKRRKVWVDKSEPFGKEANYPEGQEILEKHTKDLLLNKPPLLSKIWQITAENTLQSQKMIQTMSLYTRTLSKLENQIKSHLKLIQEYRKENRSWRKNQKSQLQKEYKSQRKLNEYF